MQTIKILAVGSLKQAWLKEAESEYIRRISPLARVLLEEIPAVSPSATVTTRQSMAREGKKIVEKVAGAGMVVALDRRGETTTSLALAVLLKRAQDNGEKVIFVVGGAAGLDEDLLAGVSTTISLSAMTFTHEWARVLLLEQVYRGLMINAGRDYHY